MAVTIGVCFRRSNTKLPIWFVRLVHRVSLNTTRQFRRNLLSQPFLHLAFSQSVRQSQIRFSQSHPFPQLFSQPLFQLVSTTRFTSIAATTKTTRPLSRLFQPSFRSWQVFAGDLPRFGFRKSRQIPRQCRKRILSHLKTRIEVGDFDVQSSPPGFYGFIGRGIVRSISFCPALWISL